MYRGSRYFFHSSLIFRVAARGKNCSRDVSYLLSSCNIPTPTLTFYPLYSYSLPSTGFDCLCGQSQGKDMGEIPGLGGCFLSLMRFTFLGWALPGCSVSTERRNMLTLPRRTMQSVLSLFWCSGLCEGTSKSPQHRSRWAASKFEACVPNCCFEQIVYAFDSFCVLK